MDVITSEVVDQAKEPMISQHSETTINRDNYSVFFDKDIPLPEKDVVRKFLTVYSILLPDVKYQLAPREVDYLTEVIFLARKGLYNLKDKSVMSELKKEIAGKVVYTYRKDLVKKGWLEQTDGSIKLIHALFPLVNRSLRKGVTFKLRLLNEGRPDIKKDTE